MTQEAVAAKYYELNGVHPMSAEDDAYVSRQYRVLIELCAEHERDVAEIRELMLAGRLPLPGYLRSDGAEMVPADLFALADRFGLDDLHDWFVGQWDDLAEGNEAWGEYLSGQLVCLHSVTPATMQRKVQLLKAIDASPEAADLKLLVDELDELEPDFAPYDRLRFDGPVSRDTYITAVRARLDS